ncbi:hypothetical protein IU441_12610 [Nocardia cyriacigeorgica]|nr:hypothetical protein [Nocardia cyriacigeorgica]
MCKAMNRSFVSVIAGGFGIAVGPSDPPASRTSLFFRENSAMLFGDARDRVEDIVKAL